MPFPRASQALTRFTVLRSHPRPGRPDLRTATGRLGRQRHQDRCASGGSRRGTTRRPTPRFDFKVHHVNKRAIALNLKRPEGLEVFRRLVEKADVVVENFRPDVKAKLGVDYESVRKINPRIVYGSISGFGQDGPYHANAPASIRSRKAWAD